MAAGELYAVDADGGLSHQLTAQSPEAFGSLAWSPDGRTIAFRRESDLAVFLADAASGRLRQLPIFTSIYLDNLSWAPDGRHIVHSATDRRGNTDLWIVTASGRQRQRLTFGGEDSQPAWSPDGKSIAYTNGSKISLIGSDGTHRRLLTIGSKPLWSPDSSMVAFIRDYGTVAVIGVGGGRVRSLGTGDSPAWSPDSRHLAAIVTVQGRGQVVVLATANGSRRILGSPCTNTGVTWAPATAIASSVICGTGGQPGLQTVDPASGARRWLIHGWLGSPAWSSGGKKLAFTVGTGVLTLANANGSGVHELLVPPVGGETHPAWSPDGRSIAVEAARTNRLRGAPMLVVSPVKLPAWSPDGKQLVGNLGDGDEDVVIAYPTTGAREQIYHDDGAGQPTLSDGAWSPDGKQIVFATENGLAWYDVKLGKLVPTTGPAGGHPDWSPDGKRLAFDTFFCDPKTVRCAISVAAADGSHARQIAKNAREPAWSPDGREIAFTRLVGERNTEIYVMNADGSEQRRLTFNPGPDVSPSWQPVR